MITFRELCKQNAQGNVIPLFERIASDTETPVSVFLKLAKGREYSFLLESIEGGEKLARYSFIGFDPFLLIEGTADGVSVKSEIGTRSFEGKPLDFLKELFSIYRPVATEGLPRFTGGAVGYFSYDCVRWQERIPDKNRDTIGLPDMLFGLYRHIIVFDHVRQEMIFIANVLHVAGEKGIRGKYDAARNWLGKTIREINRPSRLRAVRTARSRSGVVSLCDQRTFEASVRRAKRYIREGDVFQVVLSRRWQMESGEPALEVYRRLRRLNPSPYMFLLNFGNDAVIGSSPEMMVRVEHGEIETRPIAGTRPRGTTEAEDERRIEDLKNDPKELAEHTMLLDLGRNDIGRVARPGTVLVKEQMAIEKYSHVIHLVSAVTGQLRREVSALDGHFACFPAGTVSGAPKVRAMEIIDELEGERRGVYAGSIAYLDFWGNLDSCIAIRTVVKKGKQYFAQAGAGIVADSKPAREYRETQAKADALIAAVTGENCS